MVALKWVLLVAVHLTLFGLFFPGLRREFGSLAFDVLFLLLFLSPLSRILRMRLLLILMGYRRQLGILMGYLAIVHSLGYLIDPLWSDVFIRPYLVSGVWHMAPQFLIGLVAFILTLPLLVTSNNLSIRLFGANWKQLHFLVYAVFILATFHRFTAIRGFSSVNVIEAVLFIVLYLVLKWWAHRGLPEFVRGICQSVALDYREYVDSRKLRVST